MQTNSFGSQIRHHSISKCLKKLIILPLSRVKKTWSHLHITNGVCHKQKATAGTQGRSVCWEEKAAVGHDGESDVCIPHTETPALSPEHRQPGHEESCLGNCLGYSKHLGRFTWRGGGGPAPGASWPPHHPAATSPWTDPTRAHAHTHSLWLDPLSLASYPE